MSVIRNDRAAYRILDVNGFYGDDDNLYKQDEVIYWDGEPNEEMEPMNEMARVRLVAYLEKLDNLGRLAAEKAGKPFVSRPRTLDGAIEIATSLERSNMPVMGGRKDEARTIQRVDQDAVAETGSINPQKRGRGRPKGSLAA